MDLPVVHHVGLEVDHGALKEAIGQKIAGPDVGGTADLDRGVARVSVGRESGGAGHALRHGAGDPDLLVERAVEQFDHQVVALVVVFEFARGIATADQKVEVIEVGQGGAGRVAPRFGVEVEGEHEVRFVALVDQARPGVDFRGAIKEAFALGLEAGRIDRPATLAEGGGGGGAELFRAQFGCGFATRAEEHDFGPAALEFFLEQLGHLEHHVPFNHGLVLSDLEPPFLHPGPLAAEVSGVDGDAQSAQTAGGLPITRDGFGAGLIGREVQAEERLAGCGHDRGVIFGKGEIVPPRPVRRVDLGQQADKFVLGDGLLKAMERGPVGWPSQRGKFLRAGEVREEQQDEGGADQWHSDRRGECRRICWRNQ